MGQEVFVGNKWAERYAAMAARVQKNHPWLGQKAESLSIPGTAETLQIVDFTSESTGVDSLISRLTNGLPRWSPYIAGATLSPLLAVACAPQPAAQIRPAEISPSPVVPVTTEAKVAATTVAAAVATPEATQPPATPTETQIPPTVTVKPIDTATATVVPPTSTPKPEFTPTPEGPKFGDYKVWTGEIKEGGKVMIASLPNGALVFYSNKWDVKCSIADYIPFAFVRTGTFRPDSFDFRYAHGNLTGKLTKDNIVTGTIVAESYEAGTPKGPTTCPGGKFSYSAESAGVGESALLTAFRNTAAGPNRGFPPGTSDERVKQAFEGYVGMTLP